MRSCINQRSASFDQVLVTWIIMHWWYTKILIYVWYPRKEKLFFAKLEKKNLWQWSMDEIVHKHWIVLAIFTASSLSYLLDENRSTCSSCLIFLQTDGYGNLYYIDYIQQQYMYFCSISWMHADFFFFLAESHCMQIKTHEMQSSNYNAMPQTWGTYSKFYYRQL